MTRNFICYPPSKQNSPEPFDSGEFQKENDALALHILVGLKGSADGVVGGGCVGGAYGDLLGGTMRFAVVIGAIFYVAADTLDVIASKAATGTLVRFGHGFSLPFVFFRKPS